jgi:hypothetical protein
LLGRLSEKIMGVLLLAIGAAVVAATLVLLL